MDTVGNVVLRGDGGNRAVYTLTLRVRASDQKDAKPLLGQFEVKTGPRVTGPILRSAANGRVRLRQSCRFRSHAPCGRFGSAHEWAAYRLRIWTAQLEARSGGGRDLGGRYPRVGRNAYRRRRYSSGQRGRGGAVFLGRRRDSRPESGRRILA